MARRRRRRSRASGLSLGTFLFLATLLLAARHAWVAWVALAILWVFVLVLWVAFFKRTQCDVETGAGEGCGKNARGRLRACDLVKHKRAKNDALWRLVGLRNPASRYRVKWAEPRSSYGLESPQVEESPPRLMKPGYDRTMLVATVVGSVATVIALTLQFNSL